MRIWHIGAFAQPNSVNRVNATVWLVAAQQAALGHAVVLLVDNDPTPAETELAQQLGLRMLHAASGRFDYNPAVVDGESPVMVEFQIDRISAYQIDPYQSDKMLQSSMPDQTNITGDINAR